MTQQIVVVDYGSGNLRSAARAVERAALDRGVAADVRISNNPADIRAADRLVLPGQGAFADCWHGISMIPDMVDALVNAISMQKKPMLGICVGMQLMADWSHEHGHHRGMSVIAGDVVPLDPASGIKIPHMGWNDLVIDHAAHPVLDGINTGDHVYFVHSYHYQVKNPRHLLAHVAYGGPVTAMIGSQNIVATQFHPEKSQAVGLRLLGNFLTWEPS